MGFLLFLYIGFFLYILTNLLPLLRIIYHINALLYINTFHIDIIIDTVFVLRRPCLYVYDRQFSVIFL